MRGRTWSVLAALFVVVACASDAPLPTEAEVDLYDYWIEAEQPALAAGLVEIEVLNEGSRWHTLVVSKVGAETVAATPIIPPGTTHHLKLDLEPGIYEFTCRLVATKDDGALVDHFELGMVTRVTVGA
jgi:hypothetical protein